MRIRTEPRMFLYRVQCRPDFARAIALMMVLLASTLLSGGSRAQAKTDALSTYRLNSGDVISIRVFGEDDFSREKIRLTDAGTVSLPVLGEIPMLGHTVGEIEQMLTERLKGRYLVNPRVSVWIDEYRSFFVNGMVEKPGAYPFQPGLNVRKAISIAGGLKERASVNKIFIVRDKDAAHPPTKVDLNAEVAPGDTITVEESFF